MPKFFVEEIKILKRTSFIVAKDASEAESIFKNDGAKLDSVTENARVHVKKLIGGGEDVEGGSIHPNKSI